MKNKKYYFKNKIKNNTLLTCINLFLMLVVVVLGFSIANDFKKANKRIENINQLLEKYRIE